MPALENARTNAEAIGRITCINTGEEIGLLYRWDNGDTQAALYEDSSTGLQVSQSHATEPKPGSKPHSS